MNLQNLGEVEVGLKEKLNVDFDLPTLVVSEVSVALGAAIFEHPVGGNQEANLRAARSAVH